ncbi:tail fiber assembly protein [Phytobacter sp. V91]|uniref:tail fiber assembly protein n=1 Tax=Phytobacter sp. V91 TaxID=3369425 RepID=UPI003F5DD568
MKYSTDLTIAALADNGLAITAGWLQIYSIEPVTREYLQTSMEFLPEGVGLPALCYADKPELPGNGFAIIRSSDGLRWDTISDYRGLTAWSTVNGEPLTITAIGALPEGATLLAPGTEYDVWDGDKWVTDSDAQHQALVESARQELNRRVTEAVSAITTLNDAVELEIATEDEKTRLAEWKKYRVLLSRLDVSTAPDIIWPDTPAA